MRNVRQMSDEELAKDLKAFYTFVNQLGYGYLTGEGSVYFNHLKAESIRRAELKGSDAATHTLG